MEKIEKNKTDQEFGGCGNVIFKWSGQGRWSLRKDLKRWENEPFRYTGSLFLVQFIFCCYYKLYLLLYFSNSLWIVERNAIDIWMWIFVFRFVLLFLCRQPFYATLAIFFIQFLCFFFLTLLHWLNLKYSIEYKQWQWNSCLIFYFKENVSNVHY